MLISIVVLSTQMQNTKLRVENPIIKSVAQKKMAKSNLNVNFMTLIIFNLIFFS